MKNRSLRAAACKSYPGVAQRQRASFGNWRPGSRNSPPGPPARGRSRLPRYHLDVWGRRQPCRDRQTAPAILAGAPYKEEIRMFYSGVWCDVCGRKIDLAGAANKSSLTRLARKAGWAVGKQTISTWGNNIIVEKTTCPDCRRKKKT